LEYKRPMNELRPKLFDVIKGYTKEQLIKDILSGIIVAIIALPLSIALAIASGVGPVQGLYTAIVAGFFMAVLNLLTMLPYTIYSNANFPGEDASVEVLITWLYTGVVLMIVGMIVYQILVIPLEMTYYILADKPELKSTEAMKESLEMMHGNFGRYLMLKISFIPLMFLSVFTFYIALLWIFPYMAMTEVMFYRDLTEELKVQKEEEERVARDYVNPMFDSYSQSEQPQEEQTHPQQFWRMPEEPVSYENEDEQNITDNTEMQNVQADMDDKKEQNDSAPKEEEEDNEPKPWDEYFNSLK